MATHPTPSPGRQPRTQNHVPKLLYRNASPNVPTNDSQISIPTLSSSGAGLLLQDLPSTEEQQHQLRSTSQPSVVRDSMSLSSSTVSRPASNQTNQKASKKKPSFLSFFSVKEPSKQAFLDYQENLRKQQATHNRRITAVGLPMVSSAKLPSTVPKVNSKWDGVPDTVKKEKDRRRQSAALHTGKYLNGSRSGGSMHLSSVGPSHGRSVSTSSRGTESTRKESHADKESGTTLSSSQSDLSLKLDSPYTPSSVDGKDFASTFGSSTKSLPQTPLSDVSSFLSVSHLPEPPQIPPEYRRGSQGGCTDALVLPNLDISLTNTPSECSPAIPQSSSPRDLALPGSAHETKGSSNIQTTVLTLSSQDQVILNSGGTNILSPPLQARRRMKRHPFPSSDAQAALILSADSLPRKSPASSSFAIVEPQRKQGKATTSRNRNVAPWDSPESLAPPGSDDNTDRVVTLTPPDDRASVRKHKMSIFK